jgi:hypothetical protein
MVVASTSLAGSRSMQYCSERGRKASDPGHDRIVPANHVDAVVDDVAGVGHPLPADHEVVGRLTAETVADPAVIAAEPDAALDRCDQVGQLVLGDRAHGYDRHGEVEAVQGRIGEGGGAMLEAHGA